MGYGRHHGSPLRGGGEGGFGSPFRGEAIEYTFGGVGGANEDTMDLHLRGGY